MRLDDLLVGKQPSKRVLHFQDTLDPISMVPEPFNWQELTTALQGLTNMMDQAAGLDRSIQAEAGRTVTSMSLTPYQSQAKLIHDILENTFFVPNEQIRSSLQRRYNWIMQTISQIEAQKSAMQQAKGS